MPLTPLTTPPTSLRNSQLATIFYGAQASWQPMTMIPKIKYMFYANFVLNASAPSLDQAFLNALGGTAPGNISFKIKTIDKPKIDLTTVEMNQYNRKRLIYTRTEYQPFTIKIHDSVDGSATRFWQNYFMYYMGDSRPKNPTMDYLYSGSGPTNPTFDYSTGWGLSAIAEDPNFFTSLQLYALMGGAAVGTTGGTGQYQLTTYINPRIIAIDFEQHDSSSSDTEEVSITFKYEAIQYSPITSTSGPIIQGVPSVFGFGSDGKAVDILPPVNSTFTAPVGGGIAQSNNFYNPLSIAPTPSQGLNSVVATASPTPVTGAPDGYATNTTGSSTTSSDLTNSTNFIYSTVTGNAGLLNYGTA